ncbi:stereocilin-like [Haliotis rubra]|uniref:stereocilin-like n=1 Tax=Haliotis rubra TaxID=36100 RepID=UPI001EE50C52|nr:stereocilin-like [Haliotis rubra]
MRADDIDDLPDSVVADTLEDLDDMDMDDWKRKMYIYKAMTSNNNKLPSKLLVLPHFAKALSMDDIETADAHDIKLHLANAGNIKWRRGLASALFHKIRAVNPSLHVDDLHELGSIVTGMSEEDISNMRDDKMNVVNLAAQLADYDDDLTLSQSEAMAVKIRNVFHFDNRNIVEMDETDVLQVAPFLQYLPEAQFNKIKMSQPAREAFLTSMNRGAKSKISREKLMYLMGQGESMLNTQEYRMTDMGTEWDDRKVAKLGGLLQGMPDKVIMRLPGSALMRNIRSFSGAALTKVQAEAVMSKVEEHDSSWHCKRERLAQVGPFLKHLSEDKLKTICKSEMAAAASAVIKGMNRVDQARMERRRQGFMREEAMASTDGEKRVVQLIQESLSSDVTTRRRRAVDAPMCAQMKILGVKAALLEVATLSAMDHTVEFPNCLQTLGSVSDWDKHQLTALLVKAQDVYGPPNTWSVEIIRQAGSILAALTPAELSQIKLFTLDAIASAGKHHLFSQQQLKAGFYRWLNNSKANDISRVSAAEMSSLGHFICALEPSEILLFSSSAIRGALNVIGGVRSCDINQLQAFAAKTIEIYGGNVGSWNEPVISDMGIVIGGLKANQIRMLTAKQIAVINTEVIPHLSHDVMQSFTANQMSRFSSNQANALTEEQYRHLSAGQKEVISRKVTIAFRDYPAGAAGLSHLTPLSAITCLVGFFLRF